MCCRLLVVFLVSGWSLLTAQDGVPHRFTDKNGKVITASLLDVTADMRRMVIRRDDGQQFETEINILSLDDQQFIKNWLKTRVVTVPSDFRLEIEIDRDSIDTERHERDEYYTYEQRFSEYEVTIRNLSRETMPETTVQYAIVWEELLRVYEGSDGLMSYSYNSTTTEDNRQKIMEEEPLEALPFNREEIIVTEDFEINRMMAGGDIYREDDLLGVMVRILNSEGVVIEEARTGSAAIDAIEWDELAEIKSLERED
ncbi:MAG: hypothetical protein AAGA96_19030 [Verrucomicrobiota bacterium]